LLPEFLDDYVVEDNPVRAIGVFVGELNLQALGLRVSSRKTGNPAYHPMTMLKIYVNQNRSSRRSERETADSG
jgi:transposase